MANIRNKGNRYFSEGKLYFLSRFLICKNVRNKKKLSMNLNDFLMGPYIIKFFKFTHLFIPRIIAGNKDVIDSN